MDYSAVAPPTSSGSSDNTAFADALARARQIAAKINQPGADEPSSLKRPFEGTSESQPEPKKIAGMSEQGLVGAQFKAIQDQQAMADQQRAQQAVQAAANAAAQINAKLGINNQGQAPNPPPQLGAPPMGRPEGGLGGGGGGGMGLGGGMGMVHTENFAVPDRMVGLVIGKGGENLSGIQAESGVKIQFAPDSGGLPDRQCTLTGNPEGIAKAKELINRYISSKAKELIGRVMDKGQGMGDMGLGDNVVMEEVMIPGNKVGLVIGKGGENIKHLQESAGVKMVMIQDSNAPSHIDKPLRITGEPPRVQRAKDMVFDLLAEKEAQAAQYGGGGGGGGGRGTEIPVPRNLVGVIIGRGGEMIKKIQSETGARVQFKPDDGQGPDRQCSVTGGPDSVNQAAEMIHNLLNSAMQNDRGGGGGRRRRDDMDGGGGGGRRFNDNGGDETTFIVPADKTGLVIGRGGETIKEISRTSGAQVELSRDQQGDPRERVFRINGSPDQIQTAIQMIAEKAGIPPDQNGRGGPGGNGFGGPGGFGGGPPGGGFGGQSPPPGPSGPQPGGGPPQGWGNAYNQWNNPHQPAENKPGVDQNSAAWAAYYSQYYGQQGGPPNQGQQPNQQPPQQPPQQAQPPQQHQQQPNYQASVNPQTGQPDYSAAWAEYYRQQGMHYHAQAILQQAAQQNPGQPQAPGAPGPAPGGAQPPQQGGWQPPPQGGPPGTGGQ